MRISPRLSDAAMAKLAQGTKVLTEGGYEKVFQQEFHKLAGEKLLKAYACYISTSNGPVIGTLYISTQRMAFCSDYPLCHYSSSGQQEWMYFKVSPDITIEFGYRNLYVHVNYTCMQMVVDLDQLRTVNPSTNRLNPSEKYIHIVTRDGYEFWFMGLISYDKALKTLTEALHQHHIPDSSGGLVPV